ncbi:cupin domain-containing protein [Chelatococcus sp. SYSU_G07232]|uniref:Cupin domain-containing protein n=1 Tax=Chelatococcus albus TaxID=3047466 RepID=A0ABT7AL18_9HYPH|nr:cupin domain-containing protein [Chelatococcus sp. SYSU_G07232]MDJ1159296.1 cupin domain-containing protein [Chelatococcus sp. SYSU_G07232]
MTWLQSVAAAEAALSASGKTLAGVLRHGTMSVELHAPGGHAPQQPHSQDELYVVVSGRGTFFKGGERRPFGPGEVIFAEAGIEYRFETFSDDFKTWVIFGGPTAARPPGLTLRPGCRRRPLP